MLCYASQPTGVYALQQPNESNGVKSDEEAEVLDGGLGMFDDAPGGGGGVQWQPPQGAQRPKPRKLTGPWGEYSGATVAAAPKGPKKRPGGFCMVWRFDNACTMLLNVGSTRVSEP